MSRASPASADSRRLSRPRALAIALLLLAVLAYHLGMTLIYLSPPNLLKQELGARAERYMGTLFYQNWHLFSPEPGMKRQSDGINDDWSKRFSELRLGTEFDLVPAVPD